MSDYRDNAITDQLRRRVGRNLRLALIIFHDQLDLSTEEATVLIDLVRHELRGVYRGQSVGREVTAVGTSHTDLDRSFFSLSGRPRNRSSQDHGNEKHNNLVSHAVPPCKIWGIMLYSALLVQGLTHFSV